ncbi:BTB/POZ domain-containing protein At1g04390 isoform X1 [Arachis stenosperma]|uniref:BTB/POZ domain-containing protein At1g04390 isoform X1 n=1 Tax=Arachis stenosperma TaxID=217475 RepID=UPI0025ACBDD3|nr:BTB/POZ domain-containing protein At1g04390 isoform X1 [Arachis stenosperma]
MNDCSSTMKPINSRSISVQIQTLHQRLLHALNLGTRYFDEKTNTWKWQCANIEVQKNVLRSINAFLDSISGDARATRHTIVKESVSDVLGALLCILEGKSGPLLSMASNVAVKLVSILPNSLLQSRIVELVCCLSSLISSHQVEVAIDCANALNLVVSNLSATSERTVMEALKDTGIASHIVGNIKDFAGGAKKIEYFEQMGSLLNTILWRWPQSRFPVSSDVKLMKALADMHMVTDSSVKLVLLKMYTSLALCDFVAKKLIEDGVFVEMVVQAMEKSNPQVVRIEGFKLARCLLRCQENFIRMRNLCGDALVKAIICGMRETGLSSKKGGINHGSLLLEACQLGLITRWDGDHHIRFWEHGIDRVLLNLVLENIQDKSSEHVLSLEEQISTANKSLKSNYHLGLRSYLWDILGCLMIHCGENFNPYTYGSELHINTLITCACLTFVDTIQKWCRICQNDVDDNFQSEPVSRAVLMMIYSPCNHISSHARLVLSDRMKVIGIPSLKSLVHTLDYTSSLASYGSSDKVQLVINLIGLNSLSSLPEYQKCIIESKAMKAVVLIVKRCLSNDIHMERPSMAPHLLTSFHERSCCCIDKEDWEGSNVLLFYGLWALSSFVHQCSLLQDHTQKFTTAVTYIKAQLLNKLHETCSSTCLSPGVRWYASYILSYFGCYGFPNELAKWIGKSLNQEEYADLRLIVANGASVNVNGVILAVRCPSLLPREILTSSKNCEEGTDKYGETMREVRLSAHVDYEALVLLLEYVYLGCLQAEEDMVKKLKILAKRCNLQPFLQLLYRQCPEWGTPFPCLNLTSALNSVGSCFSDVILEAETNELVGWTCNFCSNSVPHSHVHKVILQSGCEYLQGLFRSGMQESHSQVIKVAISWEALIKLVQWFYSNNLPNPPAGCLWDNMDDEQKLFNLQPYVELNWLAEFWMLESIQEASWNVIVSCLDSARHLSARIIKMAYNLSLWKLVDIAANFMAPSYRQLRDSSDLEEFDEALVHLIYSASIRFAQEGGNCSR